ncbi:GNAT family N-acetyltransferase [Candidatus Woesebacteria bacterium]|nr:GNAT family N-acetyltransferase [Candidatus Woesebacteria bacterium]
MQELRTELITTLDELKTLTSEWHDLLSRSHSTVFQTPEFLLSWWETLGSGELWVTVFRTASDGRLVGIAPLMKNVDDNGKKTICFIGCVAVSDYLDYIIDPIYQEEVWTQLRSLLSQNSEWNRLYFCSIQAQSSTRTNLQQLFPTLLETQQDVCPTIQLPSDWDSYLSTLNRKQRHELKRKMRNITSQDPQFSCLTTATEVKAALPTFVRLHELSSKEKKSFWSDEHRAFFELVLPSLAASGYIKLFFLELAGEKVATMLVFEYAEGYYLYNSGFDPAYQQWSIGTVLTGYTIQQAITENKKIYDFLRGNEEYKFRFGAVAQPIFDYDVVR